MRSRLTDTETDALAPNVYYYLLAVLQEDFTYPIDTQEDDGINKKTECYGVYKTDHWIHCLHDDWLSKESSY